jgi:hypothetical protein
VKPLKRSIYNKSVQLKQEGEIKDNQRKRIKRGKGIVGSGKQVLNLNPPY